MHGWNADDPVAARAEVDPQPDWSVRYARLAGYSIYAATAMTGLMFGAVPSTGAKLLGTIAIVWSMSFFCALDARAHGLVFVQSFWRLSSIGWPISILCHLLRLRGKHGALKFALHGALPRSAQANNAAAIRELVFESCRHGRATGLLSARRPSFGRLVPLLGLYALRDAGIYALSPAQRAPSLDVPNYVEENQRGSENIRSDFRCKGDRRVYGCGASATDSGGDETSRHVPPLHFVDVGGNGWADFARRNSA